MNVAMQTAIRSWVKSASGLGDEYVFWADQKVPRPATTYIDIRIGTGRPNGALQDEVTYSYVSSTNEVEFLVTGHRQAVVVVQVFAGPVYEATSTPSAVSLALKVQLGLVLPSVAASLKAAGLYLVATEAVQNLAALLQTTFDGRARFETVFNFAETVTERAPYIEHVELTDTGRAVTFTVP